MNTILEFDKKVRVFEASYSIQLSYGCAYDQVAKFIALMICIRNELLNASLSLQHTINHGFSPSYLWDICGGGV